MYYTTSNCNNIIILYVLIRLTHSDLVLIIFFLFILAEITDIKFLCLNGTVFDQETRVCERLDEVDCSRSESFFDLNLELYGNNGAGYG